MDEGSGLHGCKQREKAGFALKHRDLFADGCGWLGKVVHVSGPWASVLACSHSSTTRPSLVFRHLGQVLGSSPKNKAVLAFLALDIASSLLSISQHRTDFSAELHKTSFSLLSGPKELEDVWNVLLTPDVIFCDSFLEVDQVWSRTWHAAFERRWGKRFSHHTNGDTVALSAGSGKVEREDYQPPRCKSPL